MADDSWRREPLGDAIEQHSQQIGNAQGFIRAMDNWDRIQKVLKYEPESSDLRARLSKSQYNSYQILLEWWNGSIQDQALSEAMRSALQSAIAGYDGQTPIYEINETKGRIEESGYHRSMYLLFRLEFLYEMRMLHAKEHDAFLGFVQGIRETGAQYAARQRIAHSFLRDGQVSSGNSRVRQEPGLLSIRLGQTIGACIESCPWLKIEETGNSAPYYLWDVTRKRTVFTHEFSSCPKYVCVSHTWGRWRIHDEPDIRLTGVPWSIPRNTKFNVEDLPEQLLVTFHGGFVWFDLLCIPQDRSERALIEISRQAAIFGNATSVVAWLNDVTSWTGLRNAAKYLSLLYLHFSVDVRNGSRKIEEVPEPEDELFEHDMELYLPERESSHEADEVALSPAELEPLPWFSSLWTLQEVCLRPDMVLCTKDWEPLATESGTLIPLDHVVALSNFIFKGTFLTALNRKNTDTSEDEALEELALDSLIPGCQDLMDLLQSTCLYDINWVSPGTVFTLGQLRHCSENRAEAIMSVVGATDWFTSRLDEQRHPPPEDSLVLGYYPGAFLNEARRKIGPTFFTAVPSDLRYLTGAIDLSGGTWAILDNGRAVGSALPFTSSSTHLQPPQKYAPAAWNHPSLADWNIQNDGSIRVRRAGIFTYSETDAIEKIEDDWITAPLIDENGQITLDSEVGLARGDLEDWLRDFSVPSEAPNYAVCLYQQIYLSQEIPGPQSGILLKQVKAKGPHVTLVKVGLYLTYSCFARDVPTTEVDWIIL
ncbi:hypothetical protein MMC18_000297 [Xylographa bjoerkii]|nr:hypothetical protein [Xylographa bjoerkii]